MTQFTEHSPTDQKPVNYCLLRNVEPAFPLQRFITEGFAIFDKGTQFQILMDDYSIKTTLDDMHLKHALKTFSDLHAYAVLLATTQDDEKLEPMTQELVNTLGHLLHDVFYDFRNAYINTSTLDMDGLQNPHQGWTEPFWFHDDLKNHHPELYQDIVAAQNAALSALENISA